MATWVLVMFFQGFGPPMYFTSQNACQAAAQQLAADFNGQGVFYCIRVTHLAAPPRRDGDSSSP